MSQANLLLASFILVNLFVVADEAAQSQFNSELTSSHHIYVGPDIFYSQYKYTQRDIPHTVKSNIMFYGFRGGYEYVKPRSIYWNLEGACAWGFRTTNVRFNDSLFFSNVEGRAGYSFQPFQSLAVVLYAGTGGYYIEFYNKKADSAWLYVAEGARTTYSFNSLFDLGLNLKGMRSVYGRTHYYHHSRFRTTNSWGYEIDLPFSCHLGKNRQWDLQLQPYFLKLSTRINEYILGGRFLIGYRC